MTAMDDDRIKRFEAQLTAPTPAALDRLREFLLYYIHDGDRDLLRLEAAQDPGPMIDAVEAIEEVLAQPQAPGMLSEIVMYEGNRMLADQSDATASSWLKQLAADLREWLGDLAPTRRENLLNEEPVRP